MVEEAVKSRLEIIRLQKDEWNDKLVKVPGTHKSGYAHFVCVVEILEGEPSDDVLRNFADGWSWNFGGVIQQRYREDGRRYVRVKVYID